MFLHWHAYNIHPAGFYLEKDVTFSYDGTALTCSFPGMIHSYFSTAGIVLALVAIRTPRPIVSGLALALKISLAEDEGGVLPSMHRSP